MPHTRRLEEGGGMQHFQDALAEAIAENVEMPSGGIITLLEAKVTRDTTQAKGVISVFPTMLEEEALLALKESGRDIKDALAKKLRLRRIPHIHWTFDHTETEAEKIEKTIEELRKRGEL
ncbi:ribosome-binding factor A [Patescibacteria group bacterium]|nr:ribosome-binding factor A [Patescibacteria group bacterium]MBU1034932.1 ribosome-binding factor A [Patescibacteria group bacterium]MBU1629688.1 ribosome-binding factor A [Patescibacteria group bacterium]MBU1908220.1 ribosome-binding factor A [Patescibacteria group bacterium]